MNSQPDEEAGATEGQTIDHPQSQKDHPAHANRSSAIDPNPASAAQPDRQTAHGEWVKTVLVADPLTIVSGVSQSRYEHFAIEVGEDGQPVELGRGAMGVTYRAIDTTLQRPVALKVISSHLIGNEILKNRFIREARAAASLRHPNVASVFYLGSTESSYFYAMELVSGETLEQCIERDGPLDPILALDITAQVASALAAANQAGLVHRDIKPANLILTKDEKDRVIVKVVDFGLVKLAAERSDDSAISDPGTFLGTPRYASPEQFSGGKIDIRSDLYAVGITLWQMLTKATPFSGTPTQVAAQHLQSPLPIGQLRQLPHPIVSLLTHLLEKNPDDRPQTPEELLAMLNATRRSIGGHAGTIEVISPLPQPRWWSSRFGKRVYVAAALVALIAGATVFIRFFSAHPAPDRRSVAVLPFDNVGDDTQNAYLSDGLTTEVIFQLSRIADLRVISRDSVLRYKAAPGSTRKPMREIGAELEVATLLESNIQRAADRLKVRSVLYDADSGKQLWSQSYDREMNDLFAIQSDVAENIAAALHVRLSKNEQDDIQRSPTENMNAYDLYLRGKEYYELLRNDANERAIALFEKAIDKDPKFALAYVGLANCYIERNVRFDEEPFWLDSAVDLCQKAIALDQKQARAYTVFARAMMAKIRPKEVREALAKAIELAPNDIEANFWTAVELPFSSLDKYTLFLKCRSLDPNDPSIPYNLARVCLYWEDDQLRDKWLRRAIHLESDEEKKRTMTGEMLVYQQDYRAALDKLQPFSPAFVAYEIYVEDLKWGCWEYLNQWSDVLQLARSDTDVENVRWHLLHETLALSATGQEDEAREKVKRLLAVATENFKTNPDDRFAAYFLAFYYRFIGEKDRAYSYLRRIFPEIIGWLPLGRNDYALRIFSRDPEMQLLMADLEKANQEKRVRIDQIYNDL